MIYAKELIGKGEVGTFFFIDTNITKVQRLKNMARRLGFD